MRRNFTWYLIIFLILILFFRFSGFAIKLAIKFWYIAVPVGVYLYISNRKKKQKRDIKGMDPDKEIKTYPPPTIEDEENGDDGK